MERVPPIAFTVKSFPVEDWTMTSVLPFGVASMPLTLKLPSHVAERR